MVKRCLDSKETFGVILIKSGVEAGGPAVPYEIGTEAMIVSHEKLADGRFYLLVSGRRRFRVDRLDYSQLYLSAKVMWLPEEDLYPVREEIKSRASRLISDYVQYMRTLNPSLEFKVDRVDPVNLSYQIARLLQISLEERQHLLGLSSAEERLQREIELLRAFIPSKRQPDYVM